jgi:hypothetical protein
LPSYHLNDLQKEFLTKFFTRDSRFFLSGGAALVEFYLGHRRTDDVDLFTVDDEIERGFSITKEVAQDLGADLEPLMTSPNFRRLLLKRGEESLVVDLVRDSVFQVDVEKRNIQGIRVDTPEEILANKLCALLSRSEIRDLVDVRALELAGYSIEAALASAEKKDSGLTAGQLAWVLSQIQFDSSLALPGDVTQEALRGYLDDLLSRLKRRTFPKAE